MRARPSDDRPERTDAAWDPEMFRLLAESVSDYAVFVVGPDRRVLTWSRGTERLLGYAAAEVVGRPYDLFFTPEDRDAGAPGRELDQALAAGRADDDRWHVRRDGTRFWSSGVVSPLRDAGGGLRGFAKVMRDRTALREAQDAVRESEERYRGVVVDMTEAVCRVRADRTILFANGAFGRLVGMSPGELIGRPGPSVAHPGDVPRVEAALATLTPANPVVQVEHRVVDAAGRERWVEFVNRGFFGPGGELTEVQAVGRDVTDRKRVQEQLARDAFVLSHVRDAVVVTDLAGAMTYWNEGAARLFGWSAGETVGRPMTDRVPAAGRAALTAALRAVRAGAEFVGEWEGYRKDGSRVWVDARVGLIRADGRPAGVLWVAHDITERKRLEGRVRDADRLEAVGRLAGGVGHEFNNLLTVIRGYAQVLLGECDERDPSRAFLEEIDAAAGRAADLTRQLLAFSRRQIVQPRVLDLNAAVAGLADGLRETLGEGVRLVTDLAPGVGQVCIDPGQAEEVLTNLAANARDAMPGGGTLTVSTRAAAVGPGGVETCPDLPPGRYAVLAVSDTGAGMPPDVLTRVFEPFSTTQGAGRGSGLGLAAVYGIASQAGGHADAESRVGEGSTFRVYLPAVPDERAAVRPGEGAATPGGEGTTVLLAEDNAGVRGLAGHLLRSLGFAVMEAPSGDEALAVAAAHPGRIDLLVTDVVMPGLPGPALAGRLAAVRPDIKVLYLSGYADDAVFRHGILERGANFLQKPFTQVGFVQKVRAVLAGPR